MQKKGISVVIAAVLIILITIAAISILWAFVFPMVKNITLLNVPVSLEIVQEGYTAWDPLTKLAEIQVKRGSDSAELDGFDFVFVLDGNSFVHEIRKDILVNSKSVYYFNFSGLKGNLEMVKLVPVFDGDRRGDVVSILMVSSVRSVPLHGASSGKIYVKPGEGNDNCDDSCDSLGYECGESTICGKKENCGSCKGGKTCNSATKKCETISCVAETKAETCRTKICGTYKNNCGDDVTCGSCKDGEMCNSTGGCEDLDLPYDYIAYYKFEDNANDETGKNNGVINGNPTFIKGFNGNAINFGGNDFVNIGKLGNFGAPNGRGQMQAGFTISLWIKTDSSNQMAVFGESSRPFILYLNNNIYGNQDEDTVYFDWRQSSGDGSRFYNSNINFNDRNWHNIIINSRLSSDSSARIQEIWFDGEKNTVLSWKDTFSTSSSWEIPVGIGIGANLISESSANLYFTGGIDEVIIYNRSLTQSEILNIYNSQLSFSSFECIVDGDCCSNNCVNNKCVLTSERDTGANCNDGRDNDCDGDFDNEDSGCFCAYSCTSGFTCYDGSCKELQTSLGTTDSITSFNITWHFDKPYTYGKFENGDYWILGPVNVISVNPLPVTVNGKYLHGSMINPKTDRNQGYNSDVPNYVSSLSVTFPKIVNPGESLVSTRSGTPPDYSDVWPDLSGVSGAPGYIHAYIKDASVLTVLESLPPKGSLRPPFVGDEKPFFNIDDINRGLLPNVPKVTGAPVSLSYYERMVERPWLNHKYGDMGRYMHPTNNMFNYYEDSFGFYSSAMTLLSSDYAKEEKEILLQRFVQLGIDQYFTLKSGEGDRHLSKGVMTFTGLLLNHSEFYDSDLKYREPRFMYYFDSENLPEFDRYGNPQRGVPGWTGALVLFSGATGDIPYEHVPVSQWKESPFNQGEEGACKLDKYKYCCSICGYVGIAITGHIMPGFREAFDCPAFFDMVDRHMTEDIDFTPVIQECGLSQVPPLYYKSANSEYANRMWQVYRESYGCIYTGADGLFRKYNCAETLVSCRDIGSCSDYPNSRARTYDPCNVC